MESQDSSNSISVEPSMPASTEATTTQQDAGGTQTPRSSSFQTNETSRLRRWALIATRRLHRVVMILMYPFLVLFTFCSLLLDAGGTQTPRSSSFQTNETSRLRRWALIATRRLHRVVMILMYPFLVLFTFCSLLLVVPLCVLPSLVCVTFGACLYYCAMEDPVPLSVLLRYMLSPDTDDHFHHHHHMPKTADRDAVLSKLIVRKVLKIEDAEGTDKNDTMEYPRQHPGPIVVRTDRKRLHFSEPIIHEAKKSADEDKGSPPASNHSSSGQEDSDDTPPTDDQELQTPQEGASQAISEPENDLEVVDIQVGRTENSPSIEVPSCDDIKSGENMSLADDLEKASNGEDTAKLKTPIGECDAKSDSVHNIKSQDKLGARDETPIGSPKESFGASSDQDRGTACDICLLDYEKGDEIAWSPNLDCVHVYHKECVLDWLIRKPTCPSCRTNYLKPKEDENV